LHIARNWLRLKPILHRWILIGQGRIVISTSVSNITPRTTRPRTTARPRITHGILRGRIISRSSRLTRLLHRLTRRRRRRFVRGTIKVRTARQTPAFPIALIYRRVKDQTGGARESLGDGAVGAGGVLGAGCSGNLDVAGGYAFAVVAFGWC
jgi:hypothetical protein